MIFWASFCAVLTFSFLILIKFRTFANQLRNMVNLDFVQNTISKELERLNEIIKEALVSNSSLMDLVTTSYLQSKGKQIRPMLVMLSAKVFSEITPTVLYAAASIEMLHNASLIHDDVVDESKLRRGNPTINNIWDNRIAVLVGDFFVSGALACGVKTGKMAIVKTMSALGSELALGEVEQIDNARKHIVSEQRYFEIISQKTASLLRSCMEVGGYAVDAPEEEMKGLLEYAQLLGICFQIKDDIFDYYDDKVIGKPTGNDLREGKITLPLLYALDSSSAADRDDMLALAQKEELTTEEIDRLIEFAKREGGIEYAYSKMEQLRNRAAEIIAGYPQNDAIRSLMDIFDYIIARKS